MDLSDPIQVALRVTGILTAGGMSHALCGGLLVAAYGEPRETSAVDLAVFPTELAGAKGLLNAGGIACVKAIKDLDDAASVLKRQRDALELDVITHDVDLLRREIPDHPTADHWLRVQRYARDP